MLQKREKEPHLRRSSDQQPPNLPQHAPPCQRLHQSPRTVHTLPSVPVQESTPWPGTGKMSGNLFEDRNWLLPQNYLATENKDENATSITSPRPLHKRRTQRQMNNLKKKCRWGPHCPSVRVKRKEKKRKKLNNNRRHHHSQKYKSPQARCPKTLNLNDRYPNKTRAKQQWEEEMERLNREV